MKILRINMNHLSIAIEDLPENRLVMGARAMTSDVVSWEVPPEADPLGPMAKLVLACGPLAGTRAPSCGRLSIGAKSPLTHGIKESNTGGPAGQMMDRLGIRALIVEGQAEKERAYVLIISKDGARLKAADDLKGLRNYDLVRKIYSRYSRKSAIISVGPAGERRWKAATIAVTDKEGHPSRQAARGGMGAVMGATGLKSIILDDTGVSDLPIADPLSFKRVVKEWGDITRRDLSLQLLKRFGTLGFVSTMNWLGGMPTHNFSSFPLQGVEQISGESIRKTNLEQGGSLEGCMPGCLVKCSLRYHNKRRKRVTSNLQYQTVAMMGTNLGIVDPDVIAQMNYFCDNMGLDTTEIGSVLGVAADVGLMKMGDSASAFRLLEEIEKETELGVSLGNGVVTACQKMGISRVPAYRGQAIPAYDPRIIRSAGISYATSPMGADHTAGFLDELGGSKKKEGGRSLKKQVLNTVGDAFGFCLLAAPADYNQVILFLRALINARFDMNMTSTDLVEIGKETLQAELAFNRQSGFYTAHDTPDFLATEGAGPKNSVFDVDGEEIEHLWDDLDAFVLEN